MNEEQRKKVMETATIEEVVISGKDISFVKENGFIPNAVETISKKTNKKHIFDLLSFWYDYEKGRMSKTDFVEKMFVYSEVNNCAISETKKKWLLEWAETESEQPQQENELPERVRKGFEYPKLISVFISPDKAREFLIYCEKYCGTDEKSKIPRQAMALVKQNIIREANVNIVLHTLLLEIGFSEEEIGNYTAWRKATLRAR